MSLACNPCTQFDVPAVELSSPWEATKPDDRPVNAPTTTQRVDIQGSAPREGLDEQVASNQRLTTIIRGDARRSEHRSAH